MVNLPSNTSLTTGSAMLCVVSHGAIFLRRLSVYVRSATAGARRSQPALPQGHVQMPDSAIAGIKGRRVWDSRGRPTVEAEVRLACGATGRAIAPAGASRGSREAQDLRDGGPRLGGMNVDRAVANVNGAIAQALVGLDALDQQRVDETLIALD